MPLVVVCPSVDDAFERAIAELQVVSTHPDAIVPHGIAWFAGGQQTAVRAVAETTASLLWPIHYSWVDPETVTSLIEAHGVSPDSILRAAYRAQRGFPILVPNSLAGRLAAMTGMRGEEAIDTVIAEGVPSITIELGDPGIVHDGSTPRSGLPDYQGPSAPVMDSGSRMAREPVDEAS